MYPCSFFKHPQCYLLFLVLPFSLPPELKPSIFLSPIQCSQGLPPTISPFQSSFSPLPIPQLPPQSLFAFLSSLDISSYILKKIHSQDRQIRQGLWCLSFWAISLSIIIFRFIHSPAKFMISLRSLVSNRLQATATSPSQFYSTYPTWAKGVKCRHRASRKQVFYS